MEDINLFSTTLRFASTNEVATVNNASITMSRIVNCNRSPNAILTLTLYFLDTATEEELGAFRDTVESFINDRPRIWDSIIFFRCETINQDLSMMEYSLRIRHTKPWQDASTILMNKAELLKFCFETGKKLRITYESPPRASWTINSFTSMPDRSPADMAAALSSSGNNDESIEKNDAPLAGGSDPKDAWLYGKAKGMRSLENIRTRIGGEFSFNR